MWKALLVSAAVLASTHAHADERTITISASDPRGEARCVEAVIGETPGRFLPDERPQVLSVRRMAAGPRDVACWYEAVIWDARRPYPGGAIAHVWSSSGPGQIFADAHWRQSGWRGALSVSAVRLTSFRADSVLTTRVSTRGGSTLTHTQLIAFDQSSGFSERILDVAAAGDMEVRIEGDRIVIVLAEPISGCRTCGRTQRIALRFNRDLGVMELDAPTSEAVAIYRSITDRARALQ